MYLTKALLIGMSTTLRADTNILEQSNVTKKKIKKLEKKTNNKKGVMWQCVAQFSVKLKVSQNKIKK